jgi:hypothetical protein
VALRVESERAAKTNFHAACDRRRFELIWDAFYLQGPFVGSGGHYSPGPATPAPLLAMWRPVNDALASPWAFAGHAPFGRCKPTRVVISLDALADVHHADNRSG